MQEIACKVFLANQSQTIEIKGTLKKKQSYTNRTQGPFHLRRAHDQNDSIGIERLSFDNQPVCPIAPKEPFVARQGLRKWVLGA
jgi:hypothetical protein